MASETNETLEKSLNFLEEIIEESIAKGETRVQTRFPPEPNGYLHIGHAKSICINFGLAKKYGGKCNLRFDDTNPVKEDVEYVDSIKRDIQWLGFDWAVERYASDYFDQLYDWAIVLIKKGLAYVDDQTQEQIRENRGTVSVPGTPSPWRDRSVEENLDLFVRMKNGEFPDGAKVLRAKIDMAHPNMLFRDPIDRVNIILLQSVMAFFGFLLNGRSLCEQLIHGALIEVQALAAQLQAFLVAEACAVDGALAGKLYRMI